MERQIQGNKMICEFKVGDKVRFHGKGGGLYDFDGTAGIATIGKIFTISAAENGYYNVEGSYYPNYKTNWNSMEKNFELVSWKERYGGKNEN